MKKIFLVLLAVGMGLPLGAKQIDVNSALGVARKFCRNASRLKSVKSASDLKLAYTAEEEGNNLYYVFNSTSGEGFVIVSADDCTRSVLGYSDKGSFDINNVNDNLRYWLSTYGKEISYVIENGIDASMTEAEVQKASSNRKPVYPLLTTKWNQGAPYNNYCPDYSTSYGKCATGCVATAMAQVMNYHEWPKKGSGSHSYTTTINGSSRTLSMNFANVTFDWDNMSDTYGNGNTTAQNNAVAKLMSACGISVDMGYGQSSGTASGWVADALLQYFDYDRSIRHYSRDVTEMNKWAEYIYTDLAAGRPVIYFGQSSGGGHCFVCDGYSQDDYYHFNWGWGGQSDGYYLLTALNPGSQGIGGSSSADGFNTNQGILCGIRKNAGTTEKYAMMCGYGDFVYDNTTSGLVYFKCGSGDYAFTSTSHYDVPLALLFAVTNKTTGNTTYYDFINHGEGARGYTPYRSGYRYPHGYLRIMESYLKSLADGTYTISPVFTVQGSGVYQPFALPSGANQSVTMTKTGSDLTFKNGSSKSASLRGSFEFSTAKVYAGCPIAFNIVLKSNNAEYLNNVSVTISRGSGRFVEAVYESEAVRMSVPTSEEVNYKMYIEATEANLKAGETYTFAIKNAAGQTVGSKEMVASEKPTDDFEYSVSECTFGDNNAVDPDDVSLKTTIDCTKGIFGGTLRAVIFDVTGTRSIGELSKKQFVVDAGSSVEFTQVAAEQKLNLASNTEYSLRLFGVSADETKVLYSMTFKTKDTSGINSVTTDGVQHTGMVTVYDIQGRELYRADAEAFDINDVDAKGVLIVRSQAGVTKVVK